MSDIIYYKNGEKTFRISPPTAGTKCPETKLEIKKMTEIEKTKQEIEVLTAKLALLEEIENHKTPCEIAYKRVYGEYPMGEPFWIVFKKGYEAHQSLVDDANKIIAAASMTNCIIEGNPPNGCSAWSEWFELFGSKGILHNLRISAKEYQPTPREPEENMWKTVALLFGRKLPVILPYSYDELSPDAWYRWVVFTYDNYMNQRDKESGYSPTPQERGDQIHKEVEKLQEKNWYVDTKTLLKSNWEPKPQTPEQVDAGLRTAMRQAKKDGVFDAVDEPIWYDEVEWDISETAPPNPAVPLYARLDDGFLYSRSGICKKVRGFLLDEGVIEYEDEECITFTLHKSLLDAPND
jgi:hypothetical protein